MVYLVRKENGIVKMDQSEYDAHIADNTTALDEVGVKQQKINLKMRVDAGTALSFDMSAEQTELDNLQVKS